MQNMTDDQRAEMPSCNLSETIHAAWSKASGKHIQNIFEATIDDFSRAFIQCTRYNAFKKGKASGQVLQRTNCAYGLLHDLLQEPGI